jgi:hypothetical protein
VGASQRCGVEMASSARLLVEALRVGDLRRVLAAYLGFTVAEMATLARSWYGVSRPARLPTQAPARTQCK